MHSELEVLSSVLKQESKKHQFWKERSETVTNHCICQILLINIKYLRHITYKEKKILFSSQFQMSTVQNTGMSLTWKSSSSWQLAEHHCKRITWCTGNRIMLGSHSHFNNNVLMSTNLYGHASSNLKIPSAHHQSIVSPWWLTLQHINHGSHKCRNHFQRKCREVCKE